MLEQLISTHFLPYLHHLFSIRLEDGQSYALELVSIQELGEGRQPGVRRPFSLLFRNARTDVYLPQRIYALEFEPLEDQPLSTSPSNALDLFLVPLGPDMDGMRYEVIFT
jgi:hypothetical protein